MESAGNKDMTTDLNSQFCIELTSYVLLKELEKGSNFVVSPLSFQVLLSLVAMGSTGRTMEQFLSCMRSKGIEDLKSVCSQIFRVTNDLDKNDAASPLLVFINGAWIDQSFCLKPSFEAVLRDGFRAQAKGVDFANKADEVIKEVNSWAEDATKGLIKNLIPSGSLDSDTALVFSNSLYFKGAWDRQFDKTKTMHKDFHLQNGQVIQVPFMTAKKNERHFYHSGYDRDYKILKIPYQSSQDNINFSMYFFLPHENNCLQNLVKKFDSVSNFYSLDFELWQEELPEFWIPKFKFSSEFEASDSVKELGLKLPFSDAGEFTEMVEYSPGNNKLKLSKIFHKSYIEVNEEGTEAAASTALVMRWCSASYPVPSFVADHPFIFMIREETSRIVFFIGAVVNPSN